MKRIFTLLSAIVVLCSLSSCVGYLEHVIYNDTEDYSGIFELTEIRYTEAMEIFPDDVAGLAIEDFYCEWGLGIVGCADVEIYLKVRYENDTFEEEISRIEGLADGEIVYDTETFSYPAYVSVLGYMNTNYYALVDEENKTVHYILLQFIGFGSVDIESDLLPDGYYGFSKVKDFSFNVYEENSESTPPGKAG